MLPLELDKIFILKHHWSDNKKSLLHSFTPLLTHTTGNLVLSEPWNVLYSFLMIKHIHIDTQIHGKREREGERGGIQGVLM